MSPVIDPVIELGVVIGLTVWLISSGVRGVFDMVLSLVGLGPYQKIN